MCKISVCDYWSGRDNENNKTSAANENIRLPRWTVWGRAGKKRSRYTVTQHMRMHSKSVSEYRSRSRYLIRNGSIGRLNNPYCRFPFDSKHSAVTNHFDIFYEYKTKKYVTFDFTGDACGHDSDKMPSIRCIQPVSSFSTNETCMKNKSQ